MEENTVKISHILFMILMVGIIIVVGTYAWLSYQTNHTAMVLTIGEINNVQVTLSPYQIKANILPQVTYTSDNYTSVDATNNSSSERNIRLYYKINSIDEELISSDFKYTIERSTDGTTYSEYRTGNFSSATNGGELTILEETIPENNTTYNYKVYLWLDGSNGGQSNIVGKSFNGELRAEILESNYTVTLDKGNFYYVSNTNSNGLQISYDENTQILTLNGQSTSSSSGVYLDRFNSNFVEGDKYAVTLTYISGTFIGSGYISIEMEIENSSGAGVSPRNNIGRYFHNLESLESVSNVVTITSAGAEQGTQYQFWIWLQGGASNYSFDNYKIKVNYSNVTETKQVRLGGTYGDLPTPTRTGYTFLGWHGDNLLENTDTLSGYSYTGSTLDTINTLDGSYSVKTDIAWRGIYINLKKLYNQNKIKIGDQLTYSIYAKPNFTFSKNTTFTIYRAYNTYSRISITPASMPANKWKRLSYTFTVDESSIESTTARIEADYYDSEDKYYLGNNRQNYIWFARPQLELNSTSTGYQPYYVTNDTEVTQNNNHTLTAMWQKN